MKDNNDEIREAFDRKHQLTENGFYWNDISNCFEYYPPEGCSYDAQSVNMPDSFIDGYNSAQQKAQAEIEKSNYLRDKSIEKYSALTDKYCNLVDQNIEQKEDIREKDKQIESMKCCGNCGKPLEDRKSCRLVEIDIRESTYRTFCKDWTKKSYH